MDITVHVSKDANNGYNFDGNDNELYVLKYYVSRSK